MIDFIHPKSNKIKFAKLYSLVIFVLLIGGLYLTILPLAPVFSDNANQKNIELSILPANLNPENNIIKDLHLPENDIIEDRLIAKVSKKSETKNPSISTSKNNITNTKVLGVSYNKNALASITPKKQDNRIIINKMGVDAKILEGDTETMLWQGVVRIGVSSTPGSGNTVITAHRYLYRPNSANGYKSFYNIDKLTPGDKIVIFWEGNKYEYEVESSRVVEPSETSILHNTARSQLTLFSCTPLFTSDKRLVVIAKQI